MSENLKANSGEAITGLFKYFPADKLFFFENCLLLLTPPKFLNDPWDFLPQGRIATDEEIIREFQKIEAEKAQSSVIHVPMSFARHEQNERLKQMFASCKSNEFAEGISKYSQQRFSSMYGIVSLTEKPLCRLMWAHYAESHAGFVAEFTATDHFEEPEEKLSCCRCAVFPAAKVKYPPSFNWIPWNAENIVGKGWSKHYLWEYEQEWRILWELDKSIHCCIVNIEKNGSERCCLPFFPENLKRVIFGMRMKPEAQQRLCTMLDRDEFRHVERRTTDIDNKTGELILKPLT